MSIWPQPIRRRILAALALPMLVSGCVFYPTLTAYDEPECHLQRYKVGMKMTTIDLNLTGPIPDDVVEAIVLAGPVTAAVSGAIFITGNVALTLETKGEVFVRKQTGHCKGTAPGTPALKASSPTLTEAITRPNPPALLSDTILSAYI